MGIIILLKANIRYKKGSFIGIVTLMIIISMSLTAILSVQDNCRNSLLKAYEQIHAGNLTVMISNQNLTEKLLDAVKNHSMVEQVVDYSSICSNKAESNGNTDGNNWFLLKLHKEYKLMNQDLTAYEDNTPALEQGEIYITQGIMTNMECNVGDMIKLFTIGGEYEFKIKGIVAEPVAGASVIGWKQLFISDEDFERLYAEAKQKETEEITADIHVLQIYKTADCTLSDGQFKRQLNLDTGIIDNAAGTLTMEMSQHYTNLFTEIIISILMVFIVFLFFIVLIVMGHSISTGIEMDYVNLGILKSQGFTQGRIRAVFVLQYLLAEVTGAAAGMIFSIPLIKSLGNVFQPIMAIIAERNLSFVKSLLILFAVLLLSSAFIFLITAKIGRISPVRALSGGRGEIYFDSRFKAPICKKGLSASLALRQFAAGKKRYISSVVIVSILVFFMMTIMILGNVMNSKSAIEAMSGMYTECNIQFYVSPDDKTLENIEKKVEEYSQIEKKYYMVTRYLSINGEEIYSSIYKNPEAIAVSKGRAPIYDNEIVITEIVADELDIKIGDMVTVSHNDQKAEYMISGIYQYINDTGRNFAMSLAGAQKLGIDNFYYGGYSLVLPEKSKEIADVLNAAFPDILEAEAVNDDGMLEDTISIAIHAMKFVIYTLSVIFALVVVMMFCTKTFLQEKTDIGIYKALGFTSMNLRLQYALRFLMIALIGSGLGTLLCILFSGRMLSSVLRLMGITNFIVSYTIFTFLVPIALICGCFFLFALLVSGKIKSIEVRELVTE